MTSDSKSLPPHILARLKRVQNSIHFDKLTTSFSIEERDANGRKKAVFYSASVSRNTNAENGETTEGFSAEDVNIARVLLCKHVVNATYSDASRRGVMPTVRAVEECKQILAAYDQHLDTLLKETPDTEQA